MNSHAESVPEIIRVDYVPKKYLLRKIKKMNGSASISNTGDMVPTTTELTVYCSQGHMWKTMAAHIDDWCEICKNLNVLRKYDSKITCCQRHYSYGQLKFEFECSRGHHFIADERTCRRGCRSCVTLEIGRVRSGAGHALTLDTMCFNSDDDARLRFHCNKIHHNPDCNNLECIAIREKSIMSVRGWAQDCNNFIICNQDFYATGRQIKHETGILKCSNNHRWDSRKEVYSVIRILETLFDKRFDDIMHRVEFTAYNDELMIACTHLADKRAAKCIEVAKQQCVRSGIHLVIIPAGITQTSKIATSIINQLSSMFEPRTPLNVIQEVRTKMHKMDSLGKIFADKCV